tara:strand:+ start:4390 stop:5667 length:1278 start_codon:yes stop_codon:yes gene_type:complete
LIKLSIIAQLRVLFLTFLLTLPLVANSQTKFITLSVSAIGETEQIAINNALIEALSQINGAVVDGNMSFETFSQSRAEGETQDYYYSKKFSQDLSKHTEGIIDSYQINNSNPRVIGGWEVEASVTIAKYALSPQANRKRIAVMPFRITDTRELIVQNKQVDKRRVLGLLNQSLVTQLTQSRKFFVADRDFVDEIYSERDFIQYGDVPLSELSKLGNDLGVDLILVGVIEDFNTKSTKKNFPSLNKTFVSTNGIVEISYRVIDVATRQVKYSNLYLSDSGTTNANADTQMILDASSKIGEDILFAIYPLRVEKILDNTLYIGQGGNQLNVGDEYQVFKLGEQINDTYTGESLGQTEELIGTAEIINVTSKMSSATLQILDGVSLDKNSNIVLILRNKQKTESNKISVSDKIKEKKQEKENEKKEIW